MDKLLEKQKSRIIALSSEQKPANQNRNIPEADVGNQPIIESVQSLEEKNTTEDVIKVAFSEPEALEDDSISLSELMTTKIIPNKSKATKKNLPPKKLQQSNLQPPQEPM